MKQNISRQDETDPTITVYDESVTSKEKFFQTRLKELVSFWFKNLLMKI